MASGEPVCSVNGPRGVTPPWTERMTRALRSTGVIGENVPRIPLDAFLACNQVVGRIDPSHRGFVRSAIENSVGIEVSQRTGRVRKGRPAMCPQRDEIIAEDCLQLVA